MKLYVTGATGFVGGHLVRRLADSGRETCCLIRKSSRVTHLEELGVSLVVGDVTKKETLPAGMTGCDGVIHLANVYSLWERDKSLYSKVNIDGTRNVLEVALEVGVSKVVHVSTVLVYGKPADSPFSEESSIGPEQFSEYARTKFEGDRIAWELHDTQGLPLVVLYPGGILGPGDQKFTGDLIRNLVSGRMPATVLDNSVFTYVHVADVVEGIVRAIEKEGNVGEKFFLGKYQLSMREFYEIVCEVSGAKLPRFRIPNLLARPTAKLLTLLADIIKRPPLWGMAEDAIRMGMTGTHVDGTKAERELGITYTSLRLALEEAVRTLED